MTKLKRAEEIWTLSPTARDLKLGAHYATVSLPWTFDRMGKGSTSKSLRIRALNIAKGIVAQKALQRELRQRGIQAPDQAKSYRDDDLYDLTIEMSGRGHKVDVKTGHYYSNYEPYGRDPLTTDLLITNAASAGPEWTNFFPMLIPHNQIKPDKEIYCFGIASSVDPRKDVDLNRKEHSLTAFPHGDYCEFLSKKKLIESREAAGKGVFIECLYKPRGSLFEAERITLTVNGEREGKLQSISVTLETGKPSGHIGPFSGITSFQVSREDYESIRSPGCIELRCSKNQYSDPVRNSLRQNINVPPTEALTLTSDDFANLILPADYKIYFIGWIRKKDFMKACRGYSAWVWPNDRIDKKANQPWQLMGEDRKRIEAAGFGDCISGTRFKAGWLKGAGSGGACCYVYPNQPRGGGLLETNLYVLPRDLQTMDTLGK